MVNEDHPETKVDENSSEIDDGVCNSSFQSQYPSETTIIDDGV